jgi:hypothetical protein
MSDFEVKDGRSKGYFWCENEIFEIKISIHAKMMYIALCRFADGNGHSFPSYPKLMEMCSMNRNSVTKALKELVEIKLVHYERRKTKAGGNTSNLYTVLDVKKVFNTQSVKTTTPVCETNYPQVVRQTTPGCETNYPQVVRQTTPGCETNYKEYSVKEYLSKGIPNEGEREEKSQHAPSEKLIFGEFGNVRLTTKQYKDLEKKLGSDVRDKCIKNLDMKLEEKEYKTNSHYATILRWYEEDKEKEPVRKGTATDSNANRNLNRFIQ